MKIRKSPRESSINKTPKLPGKAFNNLSGIQTAIVASMIAALSGCTYDGSDLKYRQCNEVVIADNDERILDPLKECHGKFGPGWECVSGYCQQTGETYSDTGLPDSDTSDVFVDARVDTSDIEMDVSDDIEIGDTPDTNDASDVLPDTPECEDGETVACDTGAMGICAEGERTCVDGVLGDCLQTNQAVTEICEDGIDQNCDGMDDECPACEDGDTRACGSNVGACEEGVQICRDGEFTPECVGEIEPTPDGPPSNCDEIDNNCDGTVDEGCECETGSTRACGSNVGACEEGLQVCIDGEWDSSCNGEISPTDEICNNIDDNCDGTPDNNIPTVGEDCVVGVGECERTGQNLCDGNAEEIICSVQPGAPGTEVCNGSDDDCDGTPDNNIDGLGDACSVGVGACAANGVNVCDTDAEELVCSAVAGEPGTETCNGLDDDCDGTADNNINGLGDACSVGVGACAADGVSVCDVSAEELICNAVEGVATDEICNNFDDDCDGSTDEAEDDTALTRNTFTCGAGNCQTTITETCTNGNFELDAVCDPFAGAQPEICGDGTDQDCNGVIDDPNICDPDGDADNDTILNGVDNCPGISNADQMDRDGDLVGDVCDNALNAENRCQTDSDMDGIGDEGDNCPGIANNSQIDNNGNGVGNECDDNSGDADGDGVLDMNDLCPAHPNPDQTDYDSDGLGDACDNPNRNLDNCE